MFYILNCSSIGVANIITILKRILDVIWIITPILAIMFLTVNIIKLMANPDEKKIPKKIKNQLLSLFIVFLIPTIVNATMAILNDSTDISSCWNDAIVKSNFEETSTYQEPANHIPRGKIEPDRSDYEKGEERTDNITPVNSTSLENLFKAARRAANHTYTRGYHYGNALKWDGTDMKDRSGNTVSCDRGVALTLYYAGLITTEPHKLGLPALSSELQRKGWKKITNYNELKPGDVVFYDREHNGSLEHTFLIGESLNKRYDWGSNDRIKYRNQYSKGMPFTEGISSSAFYYAYRMP